MKTAPFLQLVLGIWLGGSVVLGAVVAYNFSGFDDLFARNPRLQEHAGFAPEDTDAKKSSLLWVHSSELNRVFFEFWNRTQIGLGALALVLAALGRAGRLALALLAVATVLVAFIHWVFEPQIVELGRQLDFMPRNPRPPMLDEFQRIHGLYFATESLRFGLVLSSAMLLIFKGNPLPRARDDDTGRRS